MSDMSDRLFPLNLARMGEGRREILVRFAGENPTREDNETLSRAIAAIRETVESRGRTEIRGLGVFTWRPFRTRLPDGRPVRTRRLWFSSTCIGKRGARS